MRKRRRPWVVAGAAAVVGVALVAALGLAGDDEPREVTYVVSTAAPPTDGAAYVREAIENLRGMERFRFVETIAGAVSATDPASGTLVGEADLSHGPDDLPRLKTQAHLESASGASASTEQIVIGQEQYIKNPNQKRFSKALTAPQQSAGKNQGGGVRVQVVDPVMLVLEPVDELGNAAFGVPSAVDASGNRTVEVTFPQGADLVLTIDDGRRLIRRMDYTKDARRATFELSDFGSTDIDIEKPS